MCHQVFECDQAHIAATGWVSHDHGEVYEWHYTSLTFYTSEKYLRRGLEGEMTKLLVSDDDSPSTVRARPRRLSARTFSIVGW